MSRRVIAIAGMMLGMGLPVSATAQQPAGRANHRPRVFAPDDENLGFDRAAPPSDILLDALLNTAEAKDDGGDDAVKRLDRESQRKLFQVVRVDLGRPAEEDYVVLGSGPMTGADNNWFWILRVHEGKAKVLLFTNGLTIEILHRKTNGYFDIKESWGGNAGWGNRFYQYTGSTFKLTKKNWHDAKP
jgi:hypothetical protein